MWWEPRGGVSVSEDDKAEKGKVDDDGDNAMKDVYSDLHMSFKKAMGKAGRDDCFFA